MKHLGEMKAEKEILIRRTDLLRIEKESLAAEVARLNAISAKDNGPFEKAGCNIEGHHREVPGVGTGRELW